MSVMKKGLLAFDLGTSGVKCSVYDIDGLLLVDRIPIWSDARARKQADEFFGKTDYRDRRLQ